MRLFYFVADWGARHYLNVPNVLLSAGSVWQPASHKFARSRTVLPECVERVFLDSGGFCFFSKSADYPFSLQDYLDLAAHIQNAHNLEAIATLDLPCEQSVVRDWHSTNENRIRKTVSNAVACLDADAGLPWVPVIQGYRLSEYQDCIDQYREAGVSSNYWAVGTLCSRKGSVHPIRRILASIVERQPGRLHAFGLSLKYLRDPIISSLIYSADSASWNWGLSSMAEKPEAIRRYLAQVGLPDPVTVQETLEAEK